MNQTDIRTFSWKKPLLWAVLILVAVVQIFPLIWLADFSLASSNEMFTSGLLVIPKKIQWGNYVKAFIDGHFLLFFLKKQYPDKRTGGHPGASRINYGRLRMPQNELEIKGPCEDASAHGDDDSHSCDAASKL